MNEERIRRLDYLEWVAIDNGELDDMEEMELKELESEFYTERDRLVKRYFEIYRKEMET